MKYGNGKNIPVTQLFLKQKDSARQLIGIETDLQWMMAPMKQSKRFLLNYMKKV